MQSRPVFSMDHLLKERYPSFQDAVRDLDDALSMLHLFSSLPVGQISKYRTLRAKK
jgi:pescadillo